MIKEILSGDEKEKIASCVLHDLPEWFSLPDSTKEYILKSRVMPFYAAFDGDAPVGFLSVKKTGNMTAEIYVMGVMKRAQHKGLGAALLNAAKARCRADGYLFLQVKTVQMGKYKEYDQTNLFYRKMGFSEFECFPTLWDKWNPCQVYVMYVGSEKDADSCGDL